MHILACIFNTDIMRPAQISCKSRRNSKNKSQSKKQNTMGEKFIYINKMTIETFTYNLGICMSQVF
jgi:hypothetical protein